MLPGYWSALRVTVWSPLALSLRLPVNPGFPAPSQRPGLAWPGLAWTRNLNSATVTSLITSKDTGTGNARSGSGTWGVSTVAGSQLRTAGRLSASESARSEPRAGPSSCLRRTRTQSQWPGVAGRRICPAGQGHCRKPRRGRPPTQIAHACMRAPPLGPGPSQTRRPAY